MQTTDKKVIIIGGGPAGLTAGYVLAKNKLKPEVYEASDSVGGLAKTIELWGCRVDIGPHRFFSSDTRVNQLWLDVVKGKYEMVHRLTRIFYKKNFFFYPLKPLNAFMELGVVEAAKCMLSYMREKLSPTKFEGDFETWVISRFGKRLYGIFFKTYSEKLWGVSCRNLDSDFASQRIKKLSLMEALLSAFKGNKDNKHRTLVDEFAYPIGGTGTVYERMREEIEKAGGKVILNTPVKRILIENNTVTGIELKNGEIKHCTHVISSMPLTTLVLTIENAPKDVLEAAAKLKFRSTILVYLEVEGSDLFPDNWIYVHSASLKTGRITNFRNWTPDLYGDSPNTIVALEYWCNLNDADWKMTDQEYIDLASKEIKQTGLSKGRAILNGYVYRIPRCYPIYEKGYKDLLKPLENYLRTIKNLQAVGRYGAFKYNNQDHSILMGELSAENIYKNEHHDLWSINTDYESYQENSVITKTGLVKNK